MAKAKSKNIPRKLTKPTAAQRSGRVMRTDHIFAAIDKHRKLIKECDRLHDALDCAENKAQKKHGYRPSSLISWRDYPAIGGSEIDHRRDDFLQEPGADRKKIEKEYRAAKAGERAAGRAGRAWDKRAGITALRQHYQSMRRAETIAAMSMAETKPNTPAGAGALVAYARADIAIGLGPEWHLPALATAAASLAGMDAAVMSRGVS